MHLYLSLSGIFSLQTFCINPYTQTSTLHSFNNFLHSLTHTPYSHLHFRVLTGAGWSQIIDPLTFIPFWYNDDTGEANYATPKIVEERCVCPCLSR